jgi:TRAP-type mannitol/chloroaromatic compound transport system permease small subunit
MIDSLVPTIAAAYATRKDLHIRFEVCTKNLNEKEKADHGLVEI